MNIYKVLHLDGEEERIECEGYIEVMDVYYFYSDNGDKTVPIMDVVNIQVLREKWSRIIPCDAEDRIHKYIDNRMKRD